MDTERKWEIIHDYRRAVRRGLEEPWLCFSDKTELVPTVDTDGNPALRCLVCKCVSYLGLNDLEKMESQI